MNTIRKFGLEYCDLPTILWNATVLWRPLTINIDKRCTKRISVMLYIIATIAVLSWFYVYIVSMVWFVFFKSRETRDVVTATVVFSLGIATAIGASKLFFMLSNQKKIRDMVEAYLKCNSVDILHRRFARNTEKTLRIVKKRAMTFWSVIIFNGIVYCVKPFMFPGRHLMEDFFPYFGLEPMYESPNYEIAMCVTIFGVIFTVYVTANITALFIVITGYIEAQMLALSEEIILLGEITVKSTKTMLITNAINEQNLIKTELTNIIKIHAINIDLVRQTESIFRGAIAMEFILLTVALIAELLGGLENTYLQMPFALMQVAMDCLVGQRMMDANVVFENAVYESKWENFNSANMKIVLIMLQNSQKTLTLSAGGVTMLSFISLMNILKSIYSTFTALRSIVT